MSTLRTELLTDPAELGYDLADPAQIEALINAQTFSRVTSHFASERGILDRFPGGPAQADALLGKLEAFAATDQPNASIVKRALKFLAQPAGIDIGAQVTQAMLSALTPGVITPDERNGLVAMATSSCSRAEILGLRRVTDADIREALA
jgi:hypothetical protein